MASDFNKFLTKYRNYTTKLLEKLKDTEEAAGIIQEVASKHDYKKDLKFVDVGVAVYREHCNNFGKKLEKGKMGATNIISRSKTIYCMWDTLKKKIACFLKVTAVLRRLANKYKSDLDEESLINKLRELDRHQDKTDDKDSKETANKQEEEVDGSGPSTSTATQ